jgi:hypothetical protein
MNWWNNGKMWDLTNNHDDVVRGSRILDRPSKGTISPLICLNPLRLRNPLRERLFDFASLSISKTVSVSYNFLWVPPPRNLGGDPTKFRVSMCQDWRTVNPAVQIPGIRRVFSPAYFNGGPDSQKHAPRFYLAATECGIAPPLGSRWNMGSWWASAWTTSSRCPTKLVPDFF